MRAAAGRGEWPRTAATRKSSISNSNPSKKSLISRTIACQGERPRAATIRRDWQIINFQLKSFRRCFFAVASFMLALIGLKKFRSFQEPNRIDVLEKNTRRLGAGPGVAGSVAESWESGGRLQSRFGGPEAKKGRWKTLDLSATLINSWPSSVEGFFPCLAYP